ncbi:PAS domain S-box protein [bacterium]|nr:PAS domain S-box protein [bacterium]
MRFIHKIWLMPALAILLGVVVMYVSWYGSRENTSLLNQIQTDYFQGIDYINKLQDILSGVHGNLRDAVTTGDEDRIAAAYDQADKFLSLLEQCTSVPGVENSGLQSLREPFELYESHAIGLTESIIAGVPPDAVIGQAQEMRQRYESLRSSLDIALNKQVSSMDEALSRAMSAQESLQTGIVAATMVALGMLLLFASITVRSIIEPVRKITLATEALARGEIEQTLEFRSKDEMGRLANAYRAMIAAIRDRAEAARKIAAGDMEVNLAVASEADVLGRAMSAMVERITEKAKSADKISRGDLDADVPVASEADILGQAMRLMVASLRRDREQREEAAETLRQSAERLQLATRTGRVGIWDLDVQSGELIWDDLMYEIYGLDPESAEKGYARWRNHIYPDDVEAAEESLEAALEDGIPFDMEFRIVRQQDQSIRHIRAIASVIRDNNGKAERVLGTHWDITDSKQAEAERRESEERLSSLVRVAPVGICMIKDRIFLVVNDRLCEMLGRRREELIGASTRIAYFTEEAFTQAGRDIYHQIEESGTGSVETKFLTNDGGILDVIESGTPIDAKDSSKGVTVTVLDITERKKAEKALRESEEHYRNFFENSLVGLFRTRMSDGVFLEVNSITLRYLEVSKEDLIGKRSAADLYKDAAQRAELMSKLKEEGEVEGFEVDFILYNGRSITFSLTARAYPEEDYLEGVIIDITDRKQAQEALSESEEKYRRLVSQIGDGVSIVDEEERFVFANAAAEKVFGVKQGGLVGRNLSEFTSVKDYTKLMQKTQERKAGKADHYELEILSDTGMTRQIIVTASPLLNRNGEFEGVLGITHDITETRELEAQLRQAQKMEAIGTLAGGIAHDFNNILMAMIGYADMVRLNASEDSQISSDIEAVLKAGMRAKELVKQILVFSRQMDHELKPVMPHLVFKEALKLLRASLPSTIDIVQEIHADCGAVLADPTQLHQVLMNLCTNAHYAMRNSGGTLTVALQRVDFDASVKESHLQLAEGSYIKLTVSDTGHGMDKKTQERMFDPFFTTKPVGEGTGMGMATTHGIISSLGGTINVISEENIGTTFEIYLPRIEPQAFWGDDGAGQSIEKRGKGKALYVDDEEQIALLGQRMLEHLGYSIISFTKSTEAFRHFQANPMDFDFVITDQTMPDMTGTELSQRILQLRPDIPIILVTGYSEQVTPEKAKSIGIKEYIMKPLVLSELGEAISRVLEREQKPESI